MFQQNKKSKPTRGTTVDSEVEVATYERRKGSNQEKGMVNSRTMVVGLATKFIQVFQAVTKIFR